LGLALELGQFRQKFQVSRRRIVDFARFLNPLGNRRRRRIFGQESGNATSSFPQVSTITLLPAIAPQSAALKLFALGTQVDLVGIGTVKLPGILDTPAAVFVGEGLPVAARYVQFDWLEAKQWGRRGQRDRKGKRTVDPADTRRNDAYVSTKLGWPI
jgi:hypothetical protein